MARQEVGKVQEILMLSSQGQQEGESSDNKRQQQNVVGWT